MNLHDVKMLRRKKNREGNGCASRVSGPRRTNRCHPYGLQEHAYSERGRRCWHNPHAETREGAEKQSSRKSEGNITDQSCSHSNQDPVLTTAASIFTFGSRTLTAGTATSNFTGAFPALDLELLRPTRPGGSAKERVDAGGYVGLSRLKMEGVVGLSGTCLLGVGRKKKSYQRGEGSILRRSLSVPRPRFPRAPRPPQLPRVPQPRVPRAPPFPDSPSPSSRGADFSPFLIPEKKKKEERGERGQRRA